MKLLLIPILFCIFPLKLWAFDCPLKDQQAVTLALTSGIVQICGSEIKTKGTDFEVYGEGLSLWASPNIKSKFLEFKLVAVWDYPYYRFSLAKNKKEVLVTEIKSVFGQMIPLTQSKINCDKIACRKTLDKCALKQIIPKKEKPKLALLLKKIASAKTSKDITFSDIDSLADFALLGSSDAAMYFTSGYFKKNNLVDAGTAETDSATRTMMALLKDMGCIKIKSQ